jgi:hypothetical protein
MYGASTQLVKIKEACTETADRVDSPEVNRMPYRILKRLENVQRRLHDDGRSKEQSTQIEGRKGRRIGNKRVQLLHPPVLV